MYAGWEEAGRGLDKGFSCPILFQAFPLAVKHQFLHSEFTEDETKLQPRLLELELLLRYAFLCHSELPLNPSGFPTSSGTTAVRVKPSLRSSTPTAAAQPARTWAGAPGQSRLLAPPVDSALQPHDAAATPRHRCLLFFFFFSLPPRFPSRE